MSALTQDYGEEVNAAIIEAGRQATRRLVDRTKETAPIGRRRSKNGSVFKRRFDENRPHLFESISMMRIRTIYDRPAWLWYVRAPNSRIAHLVEHGYHRSSHSYSGSHFLRNAVAIEEKQYHADVVSALEKAGYEIQMKYADGVNLKYKHTVVKK